MSEAYILVVDDEPDIRAMLELVLRRFGFEVATAGSGEAALAQFESRRPDAIVLHINLPGISGFEVCGAVKARSGVPVLMMTGNSVAELSAQSTACGADGLLSKPFDITALLEELRGLLVRARGLLGRQAVV